MQLIEIRNIFKIYRLGDVEVHALKDVSLNIDKGEFVAVMGTSGSGKSTFMNILGCLDTPTSGGYYLEGTDVSLMSKDQLAGIRNKSIGFVFQGFNLLARTSAMENVELPLVYSAISASERKRRSLEALKSVGLEGREHHHPNQMSGGQQQRVAIARALVNNVPIIMADEPTGNLDSKTSYEILDLFVRLNRDSGITIILVTHEPDIAAYGKRIIKFMDGSVVSDEVRA